MTKSSHIAALAATLLLSTAAFAATGDFKKIDANGDGKITLEEGMKLHPDWTAEAYKSLDTNADGSLNELEYEAAATLAPATNDPAAPAANEAATTTPGLYPVSWRNDDGKDEHGPQDRSCQLS